MRALRGLFVVGGVVVVLAILAVTIGTVWLNSFVHSDSFRHEVEARASQTLGGPVQIQAIDFNLFTGVKLRGLVTQIDAAHIDGQGSLVANIAGINCSYSVADLLNKRLRLTGLTLEKPQLVLTRQAAATVAPPALTNGSETGQPDNAAAANSGPPFQFILDAAKLKDGSLSIRDATGASMADLNGIDVEARTAGYFEGKDVTGKIKITDLGLPSNLHLTDFSSPFTYRTGALEAKSWEARAFNGKLTGDYAMGSSGPSTLDVDAKGLDVAQISQVADPSSSTHLSGALDLQSKWQGVETGQVNGEGDLQLNGGKLEGVKILQDLSGILRVKELNAPDLKKVQTHFVISQGQTQFTGLQLDAGIFQMTGAGTIGSDGALKADMVLILGQDAMSRLPQEAKMIFVQKPDGTGSVGFKLSGNISNPQADLGTRFFMQNMKVKNVIDKALNKFFKN